ncbi:hypothetical protein [Candidatus Hodgkinia cicadicola]
MDQKMMVWISYRYMINGIKRLWAADVTAVNLGIVNIVLSK